MLSQYMVEPGPIHLVPTKHVMRYLKGTFDYGLKYTTGSEFRLCGYTNSDWAGSVEDRKSTSGSCFSLGSGVISWLSIRHTSGSLNTTEAKYIAACSTCSEEICFAKCCQECLISKWM